MKVDFQGKIQTNIEPYREVFLKEISPWIVASLVPITLRCQSFPIGYILFDEYGIIQLNDILNL